MQNLVLISESKDIPNTVDVFDGCLEHNPRAYVEGIIDSVNPYFKEIYHYESPYEFIMNIAKHIDDFVFPAWIGENSKSRPGIIPAVCEAANLRYAGSDAQTRIAFYDKAIAKSIAMDAGLRTPSFVRLNKVRSEVCSLDLQYPVIVKPSDQGTSIGISRSSICTDFEEVQKCVHELQSRQYYEIIIEEYIFGKEVSIALLGNRSGVKKTGAIEIFIEEDPTYLHSNPYEYRIKRGLMGTRSYRSMDAGECRGSINSAELIFNSLAKPHLMRLDGRIDSSGTFHFIEFALFPIMGKHSDYTRALNHHYDSYSEFVNDVISLSEIIQ